MRKITLNKKDIHRGSLILVNKENPISEDGIRNSVMLIPVDYRKSDIVLEAKAATLLSQLIASLNLNKDIIAVSGYRSKEEQEEMYESSLMENGEEFTQKYIAPPNHSEHQTGLAIDLGKAMEQFDVIRPEFPYTGQFGVFRNTAVNYGFIERYQKGKEVLTGIAHEPWHFRYVGFPHSKIMQDKELSLEEYIQWIKTYRMDGEHYVIGNGDKMIEVFHVDAAANKTTIDVDDNDLYQISGNNVDGFIITIWRKS